MATKKNKPKVRQWEPCGPLSFRRFWWDGMEAARVTFAPEKDDPNPYLWMIWSPTAGKDASSSGRAPSEGAAKEAADAALRKEGADLK